MRVLLLTPALPYPLHQGGAIRNYGLIHGLHHHGHQIWLLSFHDNDTSTKTTPLHDLCEYIETVPTPPRNALQRLLSLLTSKTPDLAQRLYDSAFANRLENLLKQQSFDLIQFEGLEMTGYLPLVKRLQPQAKLCYDAHNAEFALQHNIAVAERGDIKRLPAALYSTLQAKRIARFERHICEQVDLTLAVSDEDAAMFRTLSPSRCVHVVPNGIFTDTYAQSSEKLDLGECVLVFTGKMDYRPNIDAMLWFSNQILPRVREHYPEARLYIIGQKPHTRLQQLRDRDDIIITGWVPDIQPYLRAGAIYVAPLRMGSGTRLKILEAMAAGCAIVSTTTAATGLNIQNGDVIAIADSDEDFAQQLILLLQNPERRAVMGKAAQTYVSRHYDWSVLTPRLMAAYMDIGLE